MSSARFWSPKIKKKMKFSSFYLFRLPPSKFPKVKLTLFQKWNSSSPTLKEEINNSRVHFSKQIFTTKTLAKKMRDWLKLFKI